MNCKWFAILLIAGGLSLEAQQPLPTPLPGDEASSPAEDTQPPLTPKQELEQQIRQVDPLDRGEDNDRKAADKADRKIGRREQQDETPTPGSIAAEERNSAPRQTSPTVVSGDESSEEPVQEYAGPAVLSRSYSVNRPLIPQEVKWTESLGLSAEEAYGAAAFSSANGYATNADLTGAKVSWGVSGRHYFRRDQLAVDYKGSYTKNSGYEALTGTNNALTVDYSHVLTRRVTLNLVGTGSILSQNYTLGNEYLSPGTTVANISLSSSPNIQITDLGIKQFTTQSDLVWQRSARLSFDYGGTFFAISRKNPGDLVTSSSPGLLGMTGEQARADMNYRLTRRMTVGTYYTFSYYRFPQLWGTTQTNTVGGTFSYAFSPTMQVRLRAGVSVIQTRDLEDVPIPPAIAALLGQSSGLIDVASKTVTSDISAQFIKDFRHGKTATVAFAHGVSPGNGFFLTSVQQSMSAGFGMRLFRWYLVQATVGRDTLTAVALEAGLGGYQSDFGTISISRQVRPGLNSHFSATIRHFDLSQYTGLRNQILLSAGFNWGATNGRLWPF